MINRCTPLVLAVKPLLLYSVCYRAFLIFITMTISEIKKFLKERGIDLNTRVNRPNGGQYLYYLLAEFNDKVKRESRDKIIKYIEKCGLED